jgi:hypothetical protein
MIRRTASLIAVTLVMALAGAGALSAQSTTSSPSAPLPAQIFAAKRIFISNAAGETLDGTAVSELAYNGMYADMRSWGHYALASTPVDADLIFEIRYAAPLGPASNLFPSSSSSTPTFPQICLSIYDPKTHVVLWAFSELMVSTKHKSDREHFDETLTNVVNRVKALVAQASADATAAAAK